MVWAAQRLSAGPCATLASPRSTAVRLLLDADDLLPEGDAQRSVIGARRAPVGGRLRQLDLEAETGRRHRSPRPFVRRLSRHRRGVVLRTWSWSLIPTEGCAMARTPRSARPRVRRRERGEVLASGVSLRTAARGDQRADRPDLPHRRRITAGVRIARLRHLSGARRWSASGLRCDGAVPALGALALPVVALLQAADDLRPAPVVPGPTGARRGAHGARPSRRRGGAAGQRGASRRRRPGVRPARAARALSCAAAHPAPAPALRQRNRRRAPSPPAAARYSSPRTSSGWGEACSATSTGRREGNSSRAASAGAAGVSRRPVANAAVASTRSASKVASRQQRSSARSSARSRSSIGFRSPSPPMLGGVQGDVKGQSGRSQRLHLGSADAKRLDFAAQHLPEPGRRSSDPDERAVQVDGLRLGRFQL